MNKDWNHSAIVAYNGPTDYVAGFKSPHQMRIKTSYPLQTTIHYIYNIVALPILWYIGQELTATLDETLWEARGILKNGDQNLSYIR